MIERFGICSRLGRAHSSSRPESRCDSIVRVVDLWFVVHAKLEEVALDHPSDRRASAH